MNYHTHKADDFLRANNVSLKISKAEKTLDEMLNRSKGMFAGATKIHNKYRFTITTSKGTYWSIFWDSIQSTENGETPGNYDILACLSVDYSEDFDDFCANYGYEPMVYDSRDRYVKNTEVFNIYKAVIKQSNSLQRIFTEEQLDQLHEIN